MMYKNVSDVRNSKKKIKNPKINRIIKVKYAK